ncbi:SbmA/BacA-like family transporter [Pseudomonas fluorescens]|uniref:Inner membrane ABC transporter ATP-binding protein YddA n=1 Tax=Pseudomonas fluorescens TaxID=294 RepID=A0A5E7F1V9_PSEFL|nr:SbmA/BacA-like family transporter [Pseudomonas fluorescens]VVO32297.1 Inner membrane ABC transporter ATP-binding protein YddA [Pseudomonas fluorescens]
MGSECLGGGAPKNSDISVRDISSILSLYWKSEERGFAWVSLFALVIISLLGVVTALIINEWYNYFYNSIQELNVRRFYVLILIFFGVMIFSVLRSVLVTYLLDIMAVRWRKWLTNYYLDAWMMSYASRGIIESDVDNPDQRIAEDINKFTYETLDLGSGLIYAATSIASFGIVLINISGDVSVLGVVIPFYMFWAAIIYALGGTYAIQKIGAKLASLSNKQQSSEADFRYFLVRFRDRSSIMPPFPGGGVEKDRISGKLDVSLSNMRKIISVKVRLSLFTECYSQLSLVFSSLLAAPRFFSGSISFGDLMQINSAFGNLYENLSWFVNVYPRLADWKATTYRLTSFHRSLNQLPAL